MELQQEHLRQGTHLNPDAMINTEPEKQQGTQEEGLEEGIQRSRKPAVHEEWQREKRIWKKENAKPSNQTRILK